MNARSVFHERLTVDDSSLLLIDHHTGTMLAFQDIKMSEVRRTVLALAQTAKVHSLPVMLTASWAALK